MTDTAPRRLSSATISSTDAWSSNFPAAACVMLSPGSVSDAFGLGTNAAGKSTAFNFAQLDALGSVAYLSDASSYLFGITKATPANLASAYCDRLHASRASLSLVLNAGSVDGGSEFIKVVNLNYKLLSFMDLQMSSYYI
jgi:hypothetical protein